MPDMVTHLAAGHLLKRLSPRPENAIWFALGAGLPDIVSRAPVVLFLFLEDRLDFEVPSSLAIGLSALHTPSIYALLCLFISYCVAARWRKVVLANLVAGGLLHILLDTMQRHIDRGQLLLFPFSWQDFELGWFGTEESLTLAPFLLWLARAWNGDIAGEPKTGGEPRGRERHRRAALPTSSRHSGQIRWQKGSGFR